MYMFPLHINNLNNNDKYKTEHKHDVRTLESYTLVTSTCI